VCVCVCVYVCVCVCVCVCVFVCVCVYACVRVTRSVAGNSRNVVLLRIFCQGSSLHIRSHVPNMWKTGLFCTKHGSFVQNKAHSWQIGLANRARVPNIGLFFIFKSLVCKDPLRAEYVIYIYWWTCAYVCVCMLTCCSYRRGLVAVWGWALVSFP